jgi:MFS transporter, PAT family, beta-lactamase induction signal transducer AmpG
MTFSIYTSSRVWLLLILAFASGLPLAFTGGTLQAWATVEGIELQSIGFLTLVGTAYTLKFLWSPLIDRYSPPLLGRLVRRRGWMLLTQLLLAMSLAGMSMLLPSTSLLPLALLAVVVAFYRRHKTLRSMRIPPMCCTRKNGAPGRQSRFWAIAWRCWPRAAWLC